MFFDRCAVLVEAFEQRVLYDVPIHMSQHPLLGEYIHSMLTGCRTWLRRGELEKLCIVLLSKEGRTLTTLAIEPGWSAAFIEATGAEKDQALPLVQLEEAFRAGMVALVATAASSTMSPIESIKPHTFRILVQTVEDATNRETAINNDNASNSWVLADPFWHDHHKNDNEIVPIRTIQSEALPVRLNMYMENHRWTSMTEVSEQEDDKLYRHNVA